MLTLSPLSFLSLSLPLPFSDIDVVGEASRLYLAGLQEKVAAYCAKAEYSQTAMDLFFKIRELERSLDVKQEPGRRRARTLSNTRMLESEGERGRER